MGYEAALGKAWKDLSDLTADKRISVRFMADEYEIDLLNRKILSLSRNTPAKDYTSIIMLHYYIKKLQLNALPQPAGKWMDFRELEGGTAYYPTFKKRTIGVILRKYGADPDAIIEAAARFGAKRAQAGDTGIIIEPLERVPVLITLSRADEEFGPDANILFDETIRNIFCTEDIVVLTEIMAHTL